MPTPHPAVQRPAAERPAELRLVGRLVVGAAFAIGLAVAAGSGLPLVFYVPFGSVGALLAIRRPRTSIGWILFGIGWGFAMGAVTIDATREQFEAHAAPPIAVLLTAISQLGFSGVFAGLTALAFVFPSGRLPGGGIGQIARIALSVQAVLAAATVVLPRVNISLVGESTSVLVVNPLAILPDNPIWSVLRSDTIIVPFLVLFGVGAASLAVRYRRSSGVERQQMRWLGSAVVSVIVAVVFGLGLATIVPGTASGVAWIPAMLGFVSVPGSVLVAVLRYRLYEIDTIINRAIVYGLLTAILAGGSAASIGLLQRLFEGVIGPGSDASIILTTLIVVTAFTPIKNKLQAMVDRHFKEARSPALVLDAFLSDVRRSISRPDLDRTMERFLEVSAAAYRAPWGVLEIERRGGTRSMETGSAPREPTLFAAATVGHARATIRLAAVDGARETDALEPALAAALEATLA